MKQYSTILVLALLAVTFQNCGPGLKIEQTNQQSNSSNDATPSPDPETLPVPSPPPSNYTPTHFVAPNGTATWAQATNSGNPASAATAFANAVAGNVVQFAPGVYSGTSSNDPNVGRSPAFGFASAGTVNQAIVFYAQYPASTTANAILRSKLRDTANPPDPQEANLPIVALNNYVVLDGFWIDDSDGGKPSSRGAVYSGSPTSDFTVRRMRFDRRPANIYYEANNARANDNFNSIQLHGSTNAIITDNLFVGGAITALDTFSGAGPNRNWSAVTTYGAHNFLIEQNTFENTECGIFVKGSAGMTPDAGPDGIRGNYGTIRFNRFIQMQKTISLGEQEDLNLPTLVYQNLMYWTGPMFNPQYGMDFDNSVGPKNMNHRFYNNTVVITPGLEGGGIYTENSNVHTNSMVRDNIVAALSANSQVLVNWFEQPSPTAMAEFDYNFYYNNGATPTFAVNGVVYTGIAAWRAANGNDQSGDGIDSHSQVANPMFTDAGQFDFRLQPASPARTASSTGGPVGAYITGNEIIGVRP